MDKITESDWSKAFYSVKSHSRLGLIVLAGTVLALALIISVDYQRTKASGTAPTIVVSVPTPSSTNKPINTEPSVVFSIGMDATSLPGNITLWQGSNQVLGNAIYDARSRTSAFQPTAVNLAPNTQYTLKVTGGANGVKAADGTPMVGNFSLNYTTGTTVSEGCTVYNGFSTTDQIWGKAEGIAENVPSTSKFEGLISYGDNPFNAWSFPNSKAWTARFTNSPGRTRCDYHSITPDTWMIHIADAESLLLDIANGGTLVPSVYNTDGTALTFIKNGLLQDIATIRSYYPSVTKFVLETDVGGPNGSLCPAGTTFVGNAVRASANYPAIANAVNQLVASQPVAGVTLVPGYFEQVTDCTEYADGTGHLTAAGINDVGTAVGNFFASSPNSPPPPPLPPPPPPTDITPPTVSITNPSAPGLTVFGSLSLTAAASDDMGVVGVQFQIDNLNLGAESIASPYSVTWDTTSVPNGPHDITAIARDAAGNRTTSAAVSVNVNNTSGGSSTVILFPASDGRVVYMGSTGGCTQSSFTAARNVASGTAVYKTNTQESYFVTSGCGGPGINISRGSVVFDTSSLPDTAVITDARLGLYVTSKADPVNDGNDTITVYQNSQVSPTNLATSDFSKLVGDSVDNPTALTNGISLKTVPTVKYSEFIFNAYGLSRISTTGYTQLALREDHDAKNLWPSYAAGTGNTLGVSLSEQTGTSQDPYLKITYYIP